MSLLKTTSVALYKAESGLFSDVVLILLRVSSLSKYRKVLRYTRKCNLIYAGEKSTAFHAPICTELTSDQQNSITALSADFSLVPNVTQIGKSNVESMDSNYFASLLEVCLYIYAELFSNVENTLCVLVVVALNVTEIFI